MDYQDEDREDKKYKKGYGRKEFKKDVADAVKPELEKLKKKKGGKKFTPPKPKKPTKSSGKGMYANWGVGQLRKHLNEKKKALLTKAGFPDGGIPRSKEAMINLCKKLKRKRW